MCVYFEVCRPEPPGVLSLVSSVGSQGAPQFQTVPGSSPALNVMRTKPGCESQKSWAGSASLAGDRG